MATNGRTALEPENPRGPPAAPPPSVASSEGLTNGHAAGNLGNLAAAVTARLDTDSDDGGRAAAATPSDRTGYPNGVVNGDDLVHNLQQLHLAPAQGAGNGQVREYSNWAEDVHHAVERAFAQAVRLAEDDNQREPELTLQEHLVRRMQGLRSIIPGLDTLMSAIGAVETGEMADQLRVAEDRLLDFRIEAQNLNDDLEVLEDGLDRLIRNLAGRGNEATEEECEAATGEHEGTS